MIYDYNKGLPEGYTFGNDGLFGSSGQPVNFRYYQFIQAATYAGDGRALNVGCSCDPANISEAVESVVNLDIRDHDPDLGDKGDLTKLKGFVKGDIRSMGYKNEFDCVVFGEILEHMTWRAIFEHLEAAWIALKVQGALIITCPEEHPCRLTNRIPGKEYQYRECGEGTYPAHVNFINDTQLREALEWMGFIIIDFRIIHVFYGDHFKTEYGDVYSQKFINQSRHYLVTALKNEHAKWRVE